MNGNNIIIMRNGVAIAGVKSQEMRSQADTMEVSSSDSSVWREFVAGRKTWEFTVNYLYGSAEGFDRLLQVGTTYSIRVCYRDQSAGVEGNAIMTTCNIVATRGNLATGQFTFKGTGALTSIE